MPNELFRLWTEALGPVKDSMRRPITVEQMDRLSDLWKLRKKCCAEFAWAVPDDEAIRIVRAHSPLIEVGAGTGYWARLLADSGADIIAYDAAPPGGDKKNDWHPDAGLHFPVQFGGPEKIIDSPGRTLFVCWPPYDNLQGAPFMRECLDHYRGAALIYAGERDGCTSWDGRLDSEWEAVEEHDLPQWDGIHDYLTVFRRTTAGRTPPA